MDFGRYFQTTETTIMPSYLKQEDKYQFQKKGGNFTTRIQTFMTKH